MTVGEWDQRQLCPDGGCVGIIGIDGTCNVCGRVAPNWGDERTRGLIPPEDGGAAGAALEGDAEDGHQEDQEEDDEDDEGDDADADDDDGEADDGEAGGAASVDGDGGEWPDRELCPDGACIGVIGDDLRCKVCGKPGARGPGPKPVPASLEITAADAPADAAAELAVPPPPGDGDVPEAVASTPVNSTDPEAKS